SSLPRTHHAPHRQLLASASLGDALSAPRLHRTGQQAPCLAIHFKLRLGAVPIVEVNRRAWSERFYRNHIPQVLPDHIGDQEVDVFCGVERSASEASRFATSPSMAGRTFHLPPPHPLPALDHK